MSSAVRAHFDALCRLIGSQGNGITLEQLAGCHALARELAVGEPDAERAAMLRRGLGLETR